MPVADLCLLSDTSDNSIVCVCVGEGSGCVAAKSIDSVCVCGGMRVKMTRLGVSHDSIGKNSKNETVCTGV